MSETVNYQNRTWEVLKPTYFNPTHYILSATDQKIPHQTIVRVSDLEKHPKKAAGEPYILKDSKREYKRGPYALCKQEKERLEKLPQHKNNKLEIV